MMTNKELSLQIRKELKEKGYSNRDVSVKVRNYSSITIIIKNPEINKTDIEKITMHHESYERDAVTGEILEGGNTFVFVEYQSGIFDEVAQEWATTARGVMNSKEETTRIFDGLFLLNYKHEGRLEIRQQDKNYFGGRYVNDFKDLCIYLYKFAKFGSIGV